MPALEMKKINRMYFWASMGAVLQIVIASIIIQIIKLIINATPNNELPSLSGIGSAISNIIAVITAFVVVLKATKIFELKDLFLKPKFTVFDTILACFVVKGLGSLITTYSSIFEEIIASTFNKLGSFFSNNVMSSNSTVSVVTMLYIMILGPVLEELLFRGIILNCSSIVSRRFAIIMSSLLFAFTHGNIIQGVNSFFAGLCFAYILEKSGSIITTMIVHIFNNSSVVIEAEFRAMFVPQSLRGLAAEGTMWFFVFGAIIAAIILLRKYGKPDEEGGIRINNPINREEITASNLKTSDITIKPFVTRISFILMVIYAIYSCIKWML